MTIQPTIEVRDAKQPYVSIPMSATLNEWGKVNALVPVVFGWLAERNIPPAGAPFYRYWQVGGLEKPFHLEVGVPVNTPLPGDDRVKPGEMPAGTYLVYHHHGHPDQLGEVHQAIQDWAAEHAVTFKTKGTDAIYSACYDAWLTNPEDEPDPNRWITEVAYQVRDETVC